MQAIHFHVCLLQQCGTHRRAFSICACSSVHLQDRLDSTVQSISREKETLEVNIFFLSAELRNL